MGGGEGKQTFVDTFKWALLYDLLVSWHMALIKFWLLDDERCTLFIYFSISPLFDITWKLDILLGNRNHVPRSV